MEARLERLSMPLSLEPKRTRSFIAFDPGRVNAGLAAGMCFGPAPTADEFLAAFADRVGDRLDAAMKASAWGEPNAGNRFFMPLASFHINFDAATRDAWLHPAFEPEVRRKFTDVVEAAIVNASEKIVEGMDRITGDADRDEDPSFTLVPPSDAPLRYEAPEADVCYPNAHMVRIVAGKNTPALRATLRNVVHVLFQPEIAGMLWGFGQIPIVVEPQPEHKLRRDVHHRPHVIRMIQHAFELVITAVDYAMGYTAQRPFIYAIGKWGVRSAVMRWFPDDYASIDDIPEDETDESNLAKYNHRKQAVKRLIMLVCAAHADGHGLLAYMQHKKSKDEDETDAMALILRGHQITMRTRPLTRADLEAHAETLDQSRKLDRTWSSVMQHHPPPAPVFVGTDADFKAKRPTAPGAKKSAASRAKKSATRQRKAGLADFIASDDDNESGASRYGVDDDADYTPKGAKNKRRPRQSDDNDDDDDDKGMTTPPRRAPAKRASAPGAPRKKRLLMASLMFDADA